MTRLLPPRRLTLAAALCVLAGAAACNEDNTPPTDSSPGTLTVVVNATGTSLDNQFTIELNGGAPQTYTAGTQFVRQLPSSVYLVRISGIASNCTLQGNEVREVVVYAGQEASVTFNLTCTAVAGGVGAFLPAGGSVPA